MANLTTVGLTAGAGSSGTGTVSTLDNVIGAAGTANTNVQTVQGIASMVALKVDPSAVTSPVSLASVPSHAVTNAGTFAVQNTAATPAGTNVIGHVIVDTAPTTAVTLATNTPTLQAGTNVVGKVGIDQTTDLTTNKVRAFIHDGITAFKVAPASTLPVATDPAVIVTNRDSNQNGLALPTGSTPVVVAPQTLDVSVTPTVTASAYTAGNIMGGIMTFANILPAIGNNGILQSITVKFKASAVTGNVNLHVFKASPSNGTYGDKTAGTYNSADMANLLGSYVLPTPLSKLGTMTIYNLDGIGKAFVGASTSLFALMTVDGTPTPASTSDVTVELSVLPG